MNFFRGLIDLLNSLQNIRGDGGKPADQSGERTLPTLKEILQAINRLGQSPPATREKPPEMPKTLPVAMPTQPAATDQPASVFETVQPPKPNGPPPQPTTPTPEAFADAINRLKTNPPENLQPLNPPPPVPDHPDFEKFKKPQPKLVPQPPFNFSPPPVNIQPPGVNVEAPDQPEQAQESDSGKLAGLLSMFVGSLGGLVDKMMGIATSKPDDAKSEEQPELPEMPGKIDPSKPTFGTRGRDFAPEDSEAKRGVLSKLGDVFGKRTRGQDFTPKDSEAKRGVFSKLGEILGKGGSRGKAAAAGQAGSAMGSIGGMAAKLAGPIGLITSLGAAAYGTAKAIFAFADGVNEANRELAKYSGQMANAFAQLDVQNLQRQMELARDTGGTGSELANEMNRFGDDMQDIKETIQTFKNTFGIVGLRFLRIGWKLLESTNLIIPILQKISQLIEEDVRRGDDVPPEIQAIRELSTGQWRSEGQQGMFEDH